jgi:hypothetical protein
MTKRTLIRSALAVAAVASLAACSKNTAEVAKDDSTTSSSTKAPATSSSTKAPATSTTGPDLSNDAAAKRDFPLPTDLTSVLPAPEALETSDALFGGAGNFKPALTSPIPTAPTGLPWAQSTLGGVENVYNFDVDVRPESGLHAVRLTIRTLLFQDDAAALDAVTARRAQLTKAATPASYEFAPNSFNIRYKASQGQLKSISGVVSAKGSMVAEVIFEDSDESVDWTQECSMLMNDLLSGVLARYPAITTTPAP